MLLFYTLHQGTKRTLNTKWCYKNNIADNWRQFHETIILSGKQWVNLRCAKRSQCSVWYVCRWSPQVSAHIYTGQDAGNRGEKHSEDAKPRVSVRIVGPKVEDNIFSWPSCEAIPYFEVLQLAFALRTDYIAVEYKLNQPTRVFSNKTANHEIESSTE